MLTDVNEWEQLASWLNMDELVVEGIKASCGDECTNYEECEKCYRSKLVKYYCDQQESEDSNKVAEDIAVGLERMNMAPQAKEMRQLDFGKVLS